MHSAVASFTALASFAVCLLGCAPDTPVRPRVQQVSHSQTFSDESMASANYSEWSAPENLGSVVNSAANEQNAQLSKDGLSIYFTSNRDGGLHIYVTQRASLDSPWEPPVKLPAPVNSIGGDFAPNLSIDGHLLFFASSRDGGEGGNDIYVARRDNPNDDMGWRDVVNLGPLVNTPDQEQAPNYHQNAEHGTANLYFNRGLATAGLADIYVVAVSRDGLGIGEAVKVEELDTDLFNEQAPSLRHDAKEMFFFSGRPGGLGGGDIWTATRQNANDPWSPPVNVLSLNTASNDFTPNLSFDGLTLLFASNRPGSSGNDLYIATRSRR